MRYLHKDPNNHKTLRKSNAMRIDLVLEKLEQEAVLAALDHSL